LASSPWHHLDDTSPRINGQNSYCHIVCNPLYTAYFTTENKDRQSVLDVLTKHRPRRFLVNADALGYVAALGLSAVRQPPLTQVPRGVMMGAEAMQRLLETHLPGLGPSRANGFWTRPLWRRITQNWHS
jgi:hypothetical protein